jgi:hypothetical protein
MAALMMTGTSHQMGGMESALPNTVQFPYGFPSSGQYRVIVQMKHGQTIETGIFDASVSDAPYTNRDR